MILLLENRRSKLLLKCIELSDIYH